MDSTKDNSRGKEMISKENVPGPGAYSAKEITKNGPAYSMQSKPQIADSKSKNPGPGHVNVEYDWNTKNVNQGGWLKLDKTKDNTRGKEMISRDKVPGPGAYKNPD